MSRFVHLHVHTQYSILDGQASIPRLVDKAMADGQPGIAVTDHGNMFGIKEFYNYVSKQNGKKHDKIKRLRGLLASLEALIGRVPNLPAHLGEQRDALALLGQKKNDSPEDAEAYAKAKADVDELESMQSEFGFDPEAGRTKIAKLEATPDFKPIIGCEVYVARRRLQDKEGKSDQSGYHLILLAKNLQGYHNLTKIVSKAWTDGFYMRARTDRSELEKYHEGLICCSACLAGEVPRAITAGDLEKAEESIRWHKSVFGDDYYLELQLHKATVERANHEAYPMQLEVNKHLRELAQKYGVRTVCTNDVHFVDEDNAEAHDRLICLSTGKDLLSFPSSTWLFSS